MYAVVRFPFNDRVDQAFINKYFEPCPKVAGIFRMCDESAIVVFEWHKDELLLELPVFLEPNGLFGATYGDLAGEISPEMKAGMQSRLDRVRRDKHSAPPCGSDCGKCTQYRKICRGCPVTPFYLGDHCSLPDNASQCG